jgi:acetyl esterase/lipase
VIGKADFMRFSSFGRLMASVPIAALCLALGLPALCQAKEPTLPNIEYARVDGQPLLLDLYLAAETEAPAPLIVWVHGGAWRAGSKADVPIQALVARGVSIASVDYRLSTVARFPAQIHDIKAAIRFLRANAAKYHFNPRKFVIAGSSAGGHLAALVGVSNGQKELEGTVGDHLTVSSDVQAIVSFFGASNLETILAQSTPHGLSVRVPALELLLGGQPTEQPELAKLASPVTHVDDQDPPLLLIHGDQDPQMPINQSHELEGAYQRVKRPCQFEVIHHGAHGGPQFFDATRLELVEKFLHQSLH